MKKLVSIVLALAVLATAFTLFASANETVTALGDDYLNVPFSNGYRGFCVDYGKDQAHIGDTFTMVPASNVRSNGDSPVDVSNYLKVMLVECFHTMFVKGDDNHYAITEETRQIAQRTAWHFTDGYENYWDEIGPVVERVKTAVANGMVIPDNGYVKQVDQTTEITFDFALMETANAQQQSFFAYKIVERTWELPPEEPETPVEPEEPEVPQEPVVTPTEPEVPQEPVVTPTEPEVPAEPVVTPTEPQDPNQGEDDTSDNDGNQEGNTEETPTDVPEDGPQIGEDDGQANPPKEPVEEQQPEEPKEEPEKEPAKTPVENPKTADTSAMGAAMAMLAISASALVIFKKRK